ncbi:MAG: hypothetical protein QOE35_1091 [Actinomycetota bacterium]
MPRPRHLALAVALLILSSGTLVAARADVPDPTDPESVIDAIPPLPTGGLPRTQPLTDGVAASNCDDRDPSECLFPFPNDRFTVADPSTATGRRVDLPLLGMPRSAAGKPIDPTEWNRNDGFSPGAAVLTVVPGVDLGRTGVATIHDMGRSLDADQPVVLLDARTGARHPFWAEMDARATNPARRALIVRPAVNLHEGDRYIVALRRMRDADGSLIAPPASFSAARSSGSDPHLDAVVSRLEQAGVASDDLYLAWDFTVASTQNQTARMLKIRDDAFASLDGGAPPFKVSAVTDYTPSQSAELVRQVTGSFTVPSYLTLPNGATGSRFNYLGSTDGLPTRLGGVATMDANFTCNIPRAALSDPARGSLYGHGLLGGQSEVNAGNVKAMANEQDFMFCATDWIGMATEDLPTVGSILVDASNFPALADRVQQGMLNFLFLARLMKDGRAFASDPAFQADGHALVRTGEVFYDGNSQGGIIGGALMGVAQDITRGVLGVPGMNYSTLLDRSTDWARYEKFFQSSYPDRLDQLLVFDLMQMLWDRAEANGYAAHIATDPLPGTPSHDVLMMLAFGDHQVANVAAETEARTIGAALHCPALDPGRTSITVPFWGLGCIGAYPYNGSAIVYWDSHNTPESPLSNTPAREGADPHGFPRGQVGNRAMKGAFLRGEGVVDTCAGHPCP